METLEVSPVLPNFTGEQAEAQGSSATGHMLGQNLALNLGLPPWCLPLTPFSHTACFLCDPAGQPGLLLADGLPVPIPQGPEGLWDQLGFQGSGDSSVRISLLRGREGTLVGDYVTTELPSGEAGTGW